MLRLDLQLAGHKKGTALLMNSRAEHERKIKEEEEALAQLRANKAALAARLAKHEAYLQKVAPHCPGHCRAWFLSCVCCRLHKACHPPLGRLNRRLGAAGRPP
ncbi:hypothetical protein ABPG75_012310 [Micractinium tetrahymenae]